MVRGSGCRLSAALDSRGVLQHAAAAVLRLRHQARTVLLDGQVPSARREFGDRCLGTVLREQRTRHRHSEPERREVPRGLLSLRLLRLRLRLRLAGLSTERLRLSAEGLRLLRLSAEGLRLLRGLGAGVAVTAGRLGAVGLRGGGLGSRDEGGLEGGDEGVAMAAAARTRAPIRPRIRPEPAPTFESPVLSLNAPSGSTMVQNEVQAAKIASATPTGPSSRPRTLRGCGSARETTIRAAPMMPPTYMLITRPRLSQALGMSLPELSYVSRNDAMNSNTAAPITTPSPRVRERIFTSGSFVSRLVIGGGVADTMSPSGCGVKRGGDPSS